MPAASGIFSWISQLISPIPAVLVEHYRLSIMAAR